MADYDASQTGSNAADSGPIARPDVDSLPAGSMGPASGNAISGSGTDTGSSGADTPGAGGASVVEVHGAGGPTSGGAGNFQADGQYGVLSMDAQGNYNYVRNPGTPDGVRDVFNYTLADAQGANSASTLTIDIGTGAAAAAAAANQGIVNLPPGVELSDIHVVGRDLVIDMPDGTHMVIAGGAVFVPQLMIGDVAVPASNVAALLIDSEPQPAAGNTPSSGGNFADPVPPLDPGIPLGDLIPPTELTYTPPEYRPVGQFEDTQPSVIIITPDFPAGAVDASETVNEKGLPARNGGEPAGSGEIADGNGSNNSDGSETNTGTIVFTAQDGLQGVTINGTEVTGVGQTIQGQYGTLTITSISNGQIGYSYTLADNTSGDNTHDDFTVVVTDTDGDTATGTLTVNIIDDVPTARNDTDSIDIQTGIATGNVVTAVGTTNSGADTVGADDAHVSGVSSNNVSGHSDNDAAGGFVVDGQFGTLTMNPDGSYSYVLHSDAPGGSVDVFTYTLTDGDGDNSTATLTINNPDQKPTAGPNADVVVDDDDVSGANGNPGGTGDLSPAHTSGTLSGSGGDGALTFTFSGTGAPSGFTYQIQGNGDLWVLQGSTHVLTVTLNASTGAYTVTEVAPIDHPAGGNENNVDFTLSYTVTDADGDTANSTLHITVNDDTPLANNDSDTLDQQGVATGNVITGVGTTEGAANHDSPGADGFGGVTQVVGFGGSSDSNGSDGFSVNGHFGTLTMDTDGNYTYTRTDGLGGGGTDTFTYTYVDGDGDTVSATLTINLPDSTPTVEIQTPDHEPSVSASENVFEQGLPARNGGEPAGSGEIADGNGTNNSDPSETNTGTILFSSADGVASVTVEGSGGPVTITTVGQTITGSFGTMTITSIDLNTGQIGYSYTLADNTSGDNTHDDFSVVVTDLDGDHATATLQVNIVDDVPTANDDTDTLSVGQNSATGNVITGADTDGGTSGSGVDVVGADNSHVTGISGAGGSDTTFNNGNLDVQGTFGTLSIDANGNYTYTINQPVGQGGTDTFTYTITDGDGDTSQATLTITVPADDVPIVGEAPTLTVDEDGLANANTDNGQVNPTEANHGGNLTDSDTFNVDYGSDRPANPGDAIEFINVSSLNGQLSQDGQPITFSIDGSGHIIGQVNGAGPAVVTIELTTAVNGSGGNVTYGYEVILAGPVDQANADQTEAGITLTGVQFQVTDSDGSTGTGSFNVTIYDDVPSMTVNTGSDAGVHLDTFDSQTIGVNSSTDSSSANFGSVFSATPVAGADGAAGPVSWNYTLGAVDGTNSGLTQSGSTIYLYQLANGSVVGSTSSTEGGVSAGNTVFSVTVNSSTGVVTLTQFSEIDHPIADDPTPTGSPYSDQTIHVADGAITLTGQATITDNDGDHASDSQTVNIGANLLFHDDGPSVSNVAAGGSVSVDETTAGSPAGFPISATSLTAVITATTGSGADTPATTSYGLTITGGSGTSSGLATAIGDHPITLVQTNATTITGTYQDGGTQTAFTIHINANGTVTLTEDVPLEHLVDGSTPTAYNDTLNLSGLVNATITVTDFDGDTATGSVGIGGNITFFDDGPSISVSAGSDANVLLETFDAQTIGVNSSTASSSANFGGVFSVGSSSGGGDGAASTAWTFTLGAVDGTNSGLTQDGNTIYLYQLANGSVVGSTSATEGGVSAGNTVFSVTVNSTTGVVTLTQFSQIDHPIADDPTPTATPFSDQTIHLADGAVTLTGQATITDNDGDTASNSQTVNIGANLIFHDDGPVISNAETPLQIDNTGTPSGTGDFVFAVGADANSNHDDISVANFTVVVNGVDATNIVLTPGSENAATANYTFSFDYDTGLGGTAHETGTLVFDKGSGTYTVNLSAPIEGFTISDTAGAPAGNFVNYNDNGTTSQGPSHIATVQVASDLFIQFRGDSAPESTTVAPGGTFVPTSSATFSGIETFTGTAANVTVSSSAAGVAGNTIQGGEVLDFNLYNTDPQATTGVPTGQASSMFIELDGVGGSEDMIVVLKLYDTVTHQYSSIALMVQNGDIITSNATLANTPYSGIVLDNNDGLIVIEPNDYQNGNSNLVIVGAQVAGSDAGITGNAVNFNGALNTASDFVNTQSFATDVNDNPFKIQNIGFLTQTTTNQAAQIGMDVTVTDHDGDTATQHLTVNVGDTSGFAATLNANTLMATNAVSTQSSLDTTHLVGTNDNHQHHGFDQRFGGNANSAALLGAVAAAGLSSAHELAAQGLAGHGSLHGPQSGPIMAPGVMPTTQFAVREGPAEHSNALQGSHIAAADHQVATSHLSLPAENAHSLAGHVQAPHVHGTPQFGGTEGGHASMNAHAFTTSTAISIPSAQMLAAHAGGNAGKGGVDGHTVDAGAQSNAVVGQVLADSLAGGHAQGPNLDTLLHNATGGHGDAKAALAALASHAAETVSNVHSGHFTGFSWGHAAPIMEHMVIHQDAVQAHS